jgi:hypothetical protein
MGRQNIRPAKIQQKVLSLYLFGSINRAARRFMLALKPLVITEKTWPSIFMKAVTR